ncbi:MAG: hypothetical protein ACE5JX_06015 [Acidobacteriota bacterium]
MESCPNCNYLLIERSSHCPFCGFQLTHPLWKKVGAWVLLGLIGYGLIKCHVEMMNGFAAPRLAPQTDETY